MSEYLGVVLSTDIKPLTDNAHNIKWPENNETGNNESLARGRGAVEHHKILTPSKEHRISCTMHV